MSNDRVFQQKLGAFLDKFVLQHFEDKLKTKRTGLGPFTINAKPVAELPLLGNLHLYPRSHFMTSSKIPDRGNSMASVFEAISFNEDIDFVSPQRTNASAHAKQGYESPSGLLKLRVEMKPSRMG
ncbi:hypothetical protein GGF31_007902 [Allomyces arbusculus]|nr:hypothetical protein GGF31_007902 [Allomyces arbusculus]